MTLHNPLDFSLRILYLIKPQKHPESMPRQTQTDLEPMHKIIYTCLFLLALLPLGSAFNLTWKELLCLLLITLGLALSIVQTPPQAPFPWIRLGKIIWNLEL